MSPNKILKLSKNFEKLSKKISLSHDHEWVYEDDYAFQQYEIYWNDYLDELPHMDVSELLREKNQLERQIQESLADEQEISPMVQNKLKEVNKELHKKENNY